MDNNVSTGESVTCLRKDLTIYTVYTKLKYI